MKIESEKHTVVASAQLENQVAKIAVKASMFTLLADKLYKDKVKAVIRELCCNARDAMVEGGKPEEAFTIQLPNHLTPVFAVEDTGLGLCHEDVMHLYQTFGESTRSGTNEVTGGFGLGSKSPYAYTSMFLIESTFDGVKRTYSSFRNEENIPSTTLMSFEETDTPNGVRVSFKVKQADFPEFYRKAAEVLQGFEEVPYRVVGYDLEMPEAEFLLKGSNWRVRKPKMNRWKDLETVPSVIRMGNVEYPVDRSDLSYAIKHRDLWGDGGITITVPVGTVTPTPSREDIEINEQLQKTIGTALNEIYDQALAHFHAEIDKAPSLYEARKVYQALIKRDGLVSTLNLRINQEDVKWKNKPIKKVVRTRKHPFAIYKHTEKYSYKNNKYSPSCEVKDKFDLEITEHSKVFLVNNLKRTKSGKYRDSHIKEYVREVLKKGEGVVLITVDTKRELQDIINQIGISGREVITARQLELPEAIKAKLKAAKDAAKTSTTSITFTSVSSNATSARPKVKRKRGTAEAFVYDGSSYDPPNLKAVAGGLDYKDQKGVYLVVDRWKVITQKGWTHETAEYEKVIEAFLTYGYHDYDQVYFVKKSTSEKLEAESGWVELHSLLPDLLKTIVRSQDYLDYVNHEKLTKQLGSYVRNGFSVVTREYNTLPAVQNLCKIANDPELMGTKFAKLMQPYHLVNFESDVSEIVNAISSKLSHTYDIVNSVQPTIGIEYYTTDELSVIWDDYPMLKLLGSETNKLTSNKETTVNYIKMMEKV